jgi:hypothetical protein
LLKIRRLSTPLQGISRQEHFKRSLREKDTYRRTPALCKKELDVVMVLLKKRFFKVKKQLVVHLLPGSKKIVALLEK